MHGCERADRQVRRPGSVDRPLSKIPYAELNPGSEKLAQVMSRSKASGLTRLGFITRPGPTTKAAGDEGEAQEGTPHIAHKYLRGSPIVNKKSKGGRTGCGSE